MDQTIVDVTERPKTKVGDDAIVIGETGGQRIGADDLAALAGTIPYELLCNIGRLNTREFVE